MLVVGDTAIGWNEPANAMPAQSVDLEAALKEHHQRSFTWALACCHRDDTLAEDVLQAAYLAVLSGKAKFGGRSSFKTWLFGVIRLTALSMRRRRFLRLRHWAKLLEQEQETPPDPERLTQAAQRRTRLLAALAQLSTRQREVIELCFYHDLTVEEASAVMKVSVGTARVHYDRGKKRLRKLLERTFEGIDE